MPRRRLLILLAVVLATVVAMLAAAPGARRGTRQEAAGGVAAAAAPATVAAPAAADNAAAGAVADGPARLDAVRTVKLFCDLVNGRRLWSATGLFATQRLWTRSELRAVRSLSFRSGRVLTQPDPSTLVVVAVVSAEVRPDSPVPPGRSTLFFTLGRVGSATGGWLITAVTARPQPHRKGTS